MSCSTGLDTALDRTVDICKDRIPAIKIFVAESDACDIAFLSVLCYVIFDIISIYLLSAFKEIASNGKFCEQ